MGYEQQKEECIFRLEEAKASMRMNVSGIMQNSTLSIDIVEASDVYDKQNL